MSEGSALAWLAAGGVALIAMTADLYARRIPNWVTGLGLLLGLVLNVTSAALVGGVGGFLTGTTQSVVGALLGGFCLFPFYMIRVGGGRAIGAGDVKLLAALGCILGPQSVLSVVFYTALAGAAQSIWILLVQGYVRLWLRQTVVMGMLPKMSGHRAPYAVAIAVGVCLSAILPPIVRF
jgi:prepilin peptidase CpaA